MKVTVLYNITKNLPVGEKQDLLSTNESYKDSQEISQALKLMGISSDLFEVTEESFKNITRVKTNLFFNQCYGVGSLANSDYEVPRLLEEKRLRYTGSNEKTLELSTNKIQAKRLLEKHGVPTPKYFVIKTGSAVGTKFDRPIILKPAHEDSSTGISQKSVVTNRKDFEKQVDYLLTTYRQPVLAEDYIEGQELNVTLVGNGKDVEIFPITELRFSKKFRQRFSWAVNDFTAKWYQKSDEYKLINRVLPRNINDKMIEVIKKYSLLAFEIFGCRDYARMDIRLSKDGIPYFLEVNSNPGIGKNDGATIGCLQYTTISYPEFIKMIVIAAARRSGLRS